MDNLLLCKLTSLDFTGIVPAEGTMSLAEAAKRYFAPLRRGGRRLGVLLAPGSVTMVKHMLRSARFSRSSWRTMRTAWTSGASCNSAP